VASPDRSHDRGFSRRSFLAAIGLGGAAAYLAGCQSDSTSELPDPYILPRKNGLTDRGGYAPPAPSKPLAAPPTSKEPSANGIIPRSAWTTVGPNLATIDPMEGVKLITFHHSGDPKPFTTLDYAETAQHLEYVRQYHRSRNFQDIGYHFAIDRAGRVWQLRSLAYQGQHVRYNNEHNIGVVCLGNFDMQSMSQAQKDKVKIFGSLLRRQYQLPTSRVYTHQEIVSTECPGTNMQPYMVSIRRQRLI